MVHESMLEKNDLSELALWDCLRVVRFCLYKAILVSGAVSRLGQEGVKIDRFLEALDKSIDSETFLGEETTEAIAALLTKTDGDRYVGIKAFVKAVDCAAEAAAVGRTESTRHKKILDSIKYAGRSAESIAAFPQRLAQTAKREFSRLRSLCRTVTRAPADDTVAVPSAASHAPTVTHDRPATGHPALHSAEDAKHELIGFRQDADRLTARLAKLWEARDELPRALVAEIAAVRRDLARKTAGLVPIESGLTSGERSPEELVHGLSKRSSELPTLFASIQQLLLEEFQAFLDQLAQSQSQETRGFGSYKANVKMCELVNEIVTRFGMQLLRDGQPVTIRCVEPEQYQGGRFQLRPTGKSSSTLYSRTTWPRLSVRGRAAWGESSIPEKARRKS